MNFEPIITEKKSHSSKEDKKSFFVGRKVSNKIIAYFDGLSVQVESSNDIRELFRNGCYGKSSKSHRHVKVNPVIPASKNVKQDDNENVTLNLEESFFLYHILKVLEIRDMESNILFPDEILENFCKINNNFMNCMMAYLYLKSKNWIIQSGLKFGGNFLIYKQSPQYYHASFIVLVNSRNYSLKDVQGMQRIAETSNKDLLLLNITQSENFEVTRKIELFENLKQFKVKETVIRRFNFNQFVQSKS